MADKTILTISDEALAKIIEIRDQEPGDEEYALYLEITGIRQGQFAYELSFLPAGDVEETDVVEHHGDLTVAIAGKDADRFRGSSLGMSSDPSAPGLAMNNPNAPASPSFGSDFSAADLEGPLAQRVAQVLEQQVNPAIASHGGAAELVGVEDNTAFLRLMGGCQGCGLAAVTLGQGIERILKQAIPDLVGVVDVTDHASGENPYFQSAKK